MTVEPTTLRSAREETIDDLCRRFAGDELSLNELERRLEKARSARSRDELRALLSDLKTPVPVVAGPGAQQQPEKPRSSPRNDGIPEAATAEQRPAPSIPGAARPSSHMALAIMGGTRRAGHWVPPENLGAVAIMGSVELDFRDAVFRGGEEVEINCFAFWGGIEIVVPPDVHVDTHGFALMGAFEQVSDHGMDPPPGAPTVRINGFALMGGVDVKVVERGQKVPETEW